MIGLCIVVSGYQRVLTQTSEVDTLDLTTDTDKCTPSKPASSAPTTAIVLGGASCLFDDMRAAEALFTPDVIVAVKDIGITHPRVDHWATYHPERLPKELARRRELGLPDPLMVWTYEKLRNLPKIGIPYGKVQHRGGSSGFMGLVVACMYADKVVLCGIPMDPEMKHYSRPRKRGWPEAKYYHKTWREHFQEYRHRVRSMSGWTKDLFGEPTEEWLRCRLPQKHPSSGS